MEQAGKPVSLEAHPTIELTFCGTGRKACSGGLFGPPHNKKIHSLWNRPESLFLTEARCQIYEAWGCFKLPNKLRVSLAAAFIACSALILPVKAELK